MFSAVKAGATSSATSESTAYTLLEGLVQVYMSILRLLMAKEELNSVVSNVPSCHTCSALPMVITSLLPHLVA